MNPYSAVRPGGYAWWYFDAVSDDGERALTAIFFIGSVFSPDYAARLRRGETARAEEHLGVNLALYERGKKRAWVMSEHGAGALGGVGEGGPTIADSTIERVDHRLGSGGLRVNSSHHQAIKSVSERMQPVAWATDGVVEAAESPDKTWIVGVQWHPEMLYEQHAEHKRLFEAFVQVAREARRRKQG